MQRRLEKMNAFDVERHLKKTVDEINHHIDDSMSIMSTPELIRNERDFLELHNSVENDAAEITRVISVMSHRHDISKYLKMGQLYREERDE